MPVTVSIRFLTGRAHLHHWQAHHSDGKVEWPPSQWRLLRALVAVAGRGLTTMPVPDFVADAERVAKATKMNPNPQWPPTGYIALPDRWCNQCVADEITISQLANLVGSLVAPPEIWVPKTSGGHTRQYFPKRVGSTGSAVFDTFAVVDSQPICFHWPEVSLVGTNPDDSRESDLKQLLARLTYFGRAESWCEATYSIGLPDELQPGVSHWRCVHIGDVTPQGEEYRDYRLERLLAPAIGSFNRLETLKSMAVSAFARNPRIKSENSADGETSLFDGFSCDPWEYRLSHTPIEGDSTNLRLIVKGLWTDGEMLQCLESVTSKGGKKLLGDLLRKHVKPLRNWENRKKQLETDPPAIWLLRCLLRESGQDIQDGLDRPVGTRWVHYAVPRAVFDLPSPRPKPGARRTEMVQLVRYALNTVTTHRPVLPPLTDTLLVADKFRAAALAIHEKVVDPRDKLHPRNLCGREENGDLCRDHSHAFFWPTDEDNDGFIDHVTVFCPGGFEPNEVDALRRLLRIRQRGGRPDLLVTPVFLGRADEFASWRGEARVFVSTTPYFCPVYLSHGRRDQASGKSRGGQVRPVTAEIIKALQQQKLIETESEVEIIEELVFDFAPEELAVMQQAIDAGWVVEPMPPRQYFPVIDPPGEFPPLPKSDEFHDRRYPKACLKDPDRGYPFGQAVGMFVDQGTRFIRALSFCRRRRNVEIQGHGRMFLIVFRHPRDPRPFAIGAQCHFGLGLFRPLEPAAVASSFQAASNSQEGQHG
jgi:hypothetical protein